MVTTSAWSRYTNVCDDCRRRFRILKAELEEQRPDVAEAMGEGVPVSDADVAAVISLCHRCIYGDAGVGEFIDENPHARRWDPKGWALDTLAKSTREAVAALEEALKSDGQSEKLTHLTTRCKRRAFVAEALRDRIDGKF